MTRSLRIQTVRLTAALCCAAFSAPRPATAQYVFSPIAATGGQFMSFSATPSGSIGYNPAPSLDADGSVSFRANSPISYTSYTQYKNQGFFVAAPGGLTLAGSLGDHIFFVGPFSARNGRVAFEYAPSGGAGPILSVGAGNNNGGFGTEYAVANGFVGLGTFGGFSLAPDGVLAYSIGKAATAGSASNTGVYWSDGTPDPNRFMPPYNPVLAHLIKASDGSEIIRINSSHQVAIVGAASVQRGDTSGGPLLTFADTTGVFQSFTQAAFADSGDITFIAALKSGGTGIFRANASGVTTLVPAGSGFASITAVAANSSGQIAFEAAPAGGAAGIYTGPTPALNKVIAPGDILSGKTVSRVEVGAEGLNDAGRIAFFARFTDNTEALYVASASTTPLSGSVTLEGLSAATRIAAPTGSVTVEFRTPGKTAALYTASAPLTAVSGQDALHYSVAAPPPGTYDIAIKTDKNLRVTLPAVSVGGGAALPAVLLPAGDANGDNSVDASDFGLFVSAYNSDITIPGSGYDPTCDFNFDGAVDASDFGLLVGNYNKIGAP